MASLSIQSISKAFSSTPVLRDVSLEIQSGEFFSLLGPSGCGKSTLLRIIAGLEQADSGTIAIDGASIDSVPPQRRGIGMVFQQYALWPHMTIGQNVSFGLQNQSLTKGERDAKMQRALSRVQMEAFAHRFPHEISGGQQQRVALARALAIEPSIILLDEPLSNLDARLRVEIRQELVELHSTLGTTMISVTHDQEDALALSSRLAVIHQGAIQQVGHPTQVYRQPISPFVAKFIGDANLIPCTAVSSDDSDYVTVSFAFPTELHCTLPGPSETEVAPHTRGFICVRPRHISLVGEPAAGRPLVQATVNRVIYHGSDYCVELEMDDGSPIQARVMELPSEDPSFIGSQVSLQWEPKYSVFIPLE